MGVFSKIVIVIKDEAVEADDIKTFKALERVENRDGSRRGGCLSNVYNVIKFCNYIIG